MISPWNTIQQEFGPEAKHYQTSVEKLLKKVIKKKKTKSNFTIINLINYLSIKHLIPIAIDDYDKIQKELMFALSKGKEKVKFLRKLKPNILYYSDASGVLGTKLDYWKSSRTQVDNKTKRYLIHIDSLPTITDQKLVEIVIELEELIKTFCMGKTRKAILYRQKPTTTF